ncbi:hypothetical protein AALO_G00290320 [Alosa alosa]|uniref:DZIP3-like HEPN domain-containing protein n=1 Tax=Alosa alosa TaxID=278164 RepID=A0AAV6FGL5_9TELE|nr:uncharacterized protein CXorf38-like isoform X1 [Alosa alosa]KAG5261944.1 hypothetical protein AALO_G00290320 [Alosa alosa]
MARFKDDKYRNWLKTTESLLILREGIRPFLENETENYHITLQSKLSSTLKEAICQNKCDGSEWENKIPDCKVCTPWKKELVANHAKSRPMIYWNNCMPYLWPKEKWEVAKVYMPKGHRGHTTYDDFDIAALLNLMGHCAHFRKFIKGQQIHKVINVRNCVMHSPNHTVTNQDFQEHLEKIKDFVHLLDKYANDLKMLPDEIDKSCEAVDTGLRCFIYQSMAGNIRYIPTVELTKIEQRALKEKIEYLTQCCEEDQEDIKEDIKGIWNFVQKNEDLKVKLAPQMEQLLSKNRWLEDLKESTFCYLF